MCHSCCLEHFPHGSSHGLKSAGAKTEHNLLNRLDCGLFPAVGPSFQAGPLRLDAYFHFVLKPTSDIFSLPFPSHHPTQQVGLTSLDSMEIFPL